MSSHDRSREIYNYWKRRYEDAYHNKCKANNRVIEIQNRRVELIKEINQLTADKNDHEDSRDKVVLGINSKNDINSHVIKTNNDLDSSSENYMAMGDCDTVNRRNLVDIFSDKTTSVKKNVSATYTALDETKTYLLNKIEEFTKAILKDEKEKAAGEAEEQRLVAYMQEMDREMSRAIAGMASA